MLMRSSHSILLISLLLLTPAVQADIITYEFFGSVIGEYDKETNTSGPPVLYDFGTEVSGTFLYDAETPASSTGLDPVPLGLNAIYGPLNGYLGAASSITGSIGTTTFSDADDGVVLLSDSSPNIIDLFLVHTGNTGLTPVSVGDYVLSGISIFSVGFEDYLVDGSLPTTIPLGELNTGVNLIFRDSTGDEQIVQAHGGGSIVAVPAPDSFLLLIGGALLIFSRYLQKNRVIR